MTKTVKRHIAFWSAFAMVMAMLMYFPSGTFNIDFGLKASAEGEESIEINETNFPDENFRNYVQSFDTVDDDEILSAEEIAAVTEIQVSDMGISDLKGIEHFTALIYLNCMNNSLTSLDVSGCTALEYLNCLKNNLTSLDVSGCTALTDLVCYDNSLTTLDLSENTALEYLDCKGNPLIAVNAASTFYDDFYASPLLPFTEKTAVICLADYGINKDMITALEGGTIEDGYLKVTDYKATYTYDIDGDLGYKTISCTINVSGVVISKENFPDTNFRNYVQTLDTDYDDDILSAEEIAAVTEIQVSYMRISDLKGIEHFTVLEKLYCSENSLTSLDVNKNTALEKLYCSDNSLTSLDVRQNTALTELNCSYNSLTSLDVSKNTALTKLYCTGNQLTSLDVRQNTALTGLNCSYNSLTSLDVSKNTALKTLGCDNNSLTSLDVRQNTALTELYCYNNQLKSLDVSKNTALTELYCDHNQLTSLDVSKNTALKILGCDNNSLTSLDVSQNTALTKLDCYSNPLIAVNATSSISNFRASSLSEFTAKSLVIRLADYGINADMVSGLTGGTIKNGYLFVDGTATYTYDIDGELGTNTISCTINASGIEINDTNFPDANFREYVQTLDTDNDDILSGTEIAEVTSINVAGKGISDLKGIEYFTALTDLFCSSNQLTSLDVS